MQRPPGRWAAPRRPARCGPSAPFAATPAAGGAAATAPAAPRASAKPAPAPREVPPPGPVVRRRGPERADASGSGEALGARAYLMEVLGLMDYHSVQLRDMQQGLVATVEMACRRALGGGFERLVLVGSAALRVETPGSDVDVVCFTRSANGKEALGLCAGTLRRVYDALKQLIQQYSAYTNQFSMELIDDARVPILRVLYGTGDRLVAVDVSVDQMRPVDHVKWFQYVCAAPRPNAPPPLVAPLVTSTLRCVKWWLRQRQIPRTKEGGLPTLAWLLMAVHVCSLKETHEEAWPNHNAGPMTALLSSLTAFFRHYGSLERLDGVLRFAPDGSSSKFRLRSAEERTDMWAQLSVLDPTRQGFESLDLVPLIRPATQLLLAYELQRAGRRLAAVPRDGSEASYADARRLLEETFAPLPEGASTLPSSLKGCNRIYALVLLRAGSAAPSLELATVESVLPRAGWTAPFLHRGDERSEVRIKLFDVEARTGRCVLQKGGRCLQIRPTAFVCQVHLEKESARNKCYRLSDEAAEMHTEMSRQLTQLLKRGRPEPSPSTTAPSSVRSNSSRDSRASSTAAAPASAPEEASAAPAS